MVIYIWLLKLIVRVFGGLSVNFRVAFFVFKKPLGLRTERRREIFQKKKEKKRKCNRFREGKRDAIFFCKKYGRSILDGSIFCKKPFRA